MKAIDRPSGYFQVFNPDTGVWEDGETRQCVHCAYQWIYSPKGAFDRLLIGKPVIRGTCTKCWGLVCARPHCLAQGCVPFMKKIEAVEERYRKSPGGILLGV